MRGYTEYNSGHIPGAMNIPAGYITDALERIPENKSVVIHCASGDRSSIAASLLQSKGYSNIANLTGGFQEYAQRGQRVETAELDLDTVLA